MTGAVLKSCPALTPVQSTAKGQRVTPMRYARTTVSVTVLPALSAVLIRKGEYPTLTGWRDRALPAARRRVTDTVFQVPPFVEGDLEGQQGHRCLLRAQLGAAR